MMTTVKMVPAIIPIQNHMSLMRQERTGSILTAHRNRLQVLQGESGVALNVRVDRGPNTANVCRQCDPFVCVIWRHELNCGPKFFGGWNVAGRELIEHARCGVKVASNVCSVGGSNGKVDDVRADERGSNSSVGRRLVFLGTVAPAH